MQPENKTAKPAPLQPAITPDNIKDVFQFVADETGEAKRAAEENPFTSAGKPKDTLKGAAAITNRLKEEGIAAHARGIVEKPDMIGGLKNNDMHVAATSALEGLRISELQQPVLLEENEE